MQVIVTQIIRYSSESVFQRLPIDLMQGILEELNFSNLNKLLAVSKVFCQIIEQCPLSIKNSYNLFNLIDRVNKYESERIQFWCKFITTVGFELDNYSVQEKMSHLSSLLSTKVGPKKLFPAVNKFFVSFEEHQLINSLKDLKNELKNKKFKHFSKFELQYIFDFQHVASLDLSCTDLHSEIKNVIEVMENLREVTFSPGVKLSYYFSEVSRGLFKFCEFNKAFNETPFDSAELSVNYSDGRVLCGDPSELSDEKSERLLFINQLFLKSVMGTLKYQYVKSPETCSWSGPADTLICSRQEPFKFIHDIIDEVESKIYYGSPEFENLILPYTLYGDFDLTELIKKLTNFFSRFKNLKKILLVPQISLGFDMRKNVSCQLAHETLISELMKFTKEKEIKFGMDFSQAYREPLCWESILGNVGMVDDTKEFRYKLVKAALIVAIKNLHKNNL